MRFRAPLAMAPPPMVWSGTRSASNRMVRGSGVRMAACATFSAAARYFSIRIGEMVSTSPMLSKP